MAGMVWAKIDDTWDDCVEFNAMSSDAMALFFRSQARMGRLMTDGHLQVSDLEHLDLSRSSAERRRASWRRLVSELVSRGIFEVHAGGWRDTGWWERNPSSEEVILQRRWDALRQQQRMHKGSPKRSLWRRRSTESSAASGRYARPARLVASLVSMDVRP